MAAFLPCPLLMGGSWSGRQVLGGCEDVGEDGAAGAAGDDEEAVGGLVGMGCPGALGAGFAG
jgi:hypothetical protein